MIVKLLTELNLEFLSLKEVGQAPLNLFMSKYHIVRNHVSRLTYICHLSTVKTAKKKTQI